MEIYSPFLEMQRTEGQIKSLLRGVDVQLLDLPGRKALSAVRRLAIDARMDIRDYELSETREEQVTCAATARKRLIKLRQMILDLGSTFGPADVAQLTAQLELIESYLR